MVLDLTRKLEELKTSYMDLENKYKAAQEYNNQSAIIMTQKVSFLLLSNENRLKLYQN